MGVPCKGSIVEKGMQQTEAIYICMYELHYIPKYTDGNY